MPVKCANCGICDPKPQKYKNVKPRLRKCENVFFCSQECHDKIEHNCHVPVIEVYQHINFLRIGGRI